MSTPHSRSGAPLTNAASPVGIVQPTDKLRRTEKLQRGLGAG